jgi:P4 family phage/plasmid primase-like protien
MSEKSFPERLYEAGFTDLISVIPPGAQLMPSSKISQTLVGKIPGRRHASGLWAGYNWRVADATIDDVRKWVFDGANVGLRATKFPAVDIDCSDANLAGIIEDAVRGQLGPAACRVGKAPKRLLMYSLSPLAEPFSRMRLWITTPDGTKHLVEILGEGQQYLVSGTHPSGRVYEWLQDPTTVDEAEIDVDKATAFLDYLEQLITVMGFGTVEREGDGKRSTRTAAADQKALMAPTIDALRDAVAAIPNANEDFPTRTDYLRVGYAIKAAAGNEHDEDGYEIFAGWAARWDEGTNDPEVVRDDWRRLNPPYSVGWNFIAQKARQYGFNDAAAEFDVIDEAPPAGQSPEDSAPAYSDQDLADTIIARHRDVLRYVPQNGKYMVWDGARWQIDAELQAEDLILRALKKIANDVIRQGVTPKEKKDALETANRICSAGKASAVAQVIRPNRAIAVSVASLDHDPWVLNTPAGLVDLKTGTLQPPNPDALATKMTTVPPDFVGTAPQWLRFLEEATAGDKDLEGYLQRLAGYALTGSTREQQLSFLFGPGGNGKTVFLNQLTGILGDYAKIATMDTFTASNSEKHSTDLANLVGARLVAASETSAAKRWDEQRIKSLTGGEPVTARFMRQDNFTFTPQAKLVFIGNHQPEIRDVDKAMRRRIQMVPFIVQPKQIDLDLSVKLQTEWPAILAWMIEGCLAWQKVGLTPPAAVKVATEEYFDNEDIYGRWIRESLDVDAPPAVITTTADLFRSWEEWANPRKEYAGSMKRLSSALIARGWTKTQEPGTRRMGFAGVRILQRQDLEAL